MQYQSKKWLGLLLAVLMLVSLLPVAALAADAADVTEEELTAYALDGDDANGDDDVNKGDDDVNNGDDDVNKGDDDVNNGDDDVNKGDDDVNKGDDDVNKGDDDVNKGDDEEEEKPVTVSFPIEKTVAVKNKGTDLGTNTFEFLLVADYPKGEDFQVFYTPEGGESQELTQAKEDGEWGIQIGEVYYARTVRYYSFSMTVDGAATVKGTVTVKAMASTICDANVEVYEIGTAPENWEYGYQMYSVGFCDEEGNLLESGGISKNPKLTEEEAADSWSILGGDGFYYQLGSPEQVAVASYTNTYTGPGPAELSFSVEKTVAVKNKGANPGKNTFEFLLVADYPKGEDFQVFYTPEGGEPQELTQAKEDGEWGIQIGEVYYARTVRYYSFSMTVDGAATAKGTVTVKAMTSTICDANVEVYEIGTAPENWEYGYQMYSVGFCDEEGNLLESGGISTYPKLTEEEAEASSWPYLGKDGYYYEQGAPEQVNAASYTNTYTGAAPASSGKHAPKTGDEANLALWLVLATVSTAAIAVVVSKKKVK